MIENEMDYRAGSCPSDIQNQKKHLEIRIHFILRISRRPGLFLLFLFIIGQAGAQKTLTNPLLPNGADPWVIYKDGYYYYTQTMRNNITLWKTRDMAKLASAEKKIIFKPARGTAYSDALWAPELHFLWGKWYLYFAADSGNNKDHRMWVLENASSDPFSDNWKLKGKLLTPGDKWSIDGTVFEHKKKLYFFWSGWEGDHNGQQNIYIARMKNPWTLEDKRICLSSPNMEWEKHGDLHNPTDVSHVNVNEGPELLRKKNRIFLVYSANGCWTDHYSLGMLSINAKDNLLDSASWNKSTQSVFRQSPENGVYAPGHNAFFQSPDGKEYWILYHANSQPGLGCGKARSPRAQPFTWKEDGTPDFGVPVPEGLALPAPGEKRKKLKSK